MAPSCVQPCTPAVKRCFVQHKTLLTPPPPKTQIELDRSGEGGMMVDDGGSFEALYDDERMMMGEVMPGLGPAGGLPGVGRIKR